FYMHRVMLNNIAVYYFLMLIRQPTTSTLFPYTTLFRSLEDVDGLDGLARDALVGHHFLIAPAEAAVRVALLLVKEILQVPALDPDRKSTRLNSSHVKISYAVFCLKKKNKLIKHLKHAFI